MSDIRKKSIQATIWIYLGFFIGILNTYLLTSDQFFTTSQNGLTRSLLDISQLLFAFSCLGVPAFLFKFFPYYQHNLDKRNNDMLFLSLKIVLIGFILTLAGFLLMQPLFTRKFSEKSMLLVQYYYWIIPMGFFLLFYNVFEAYAFGFDKGILTSFLRETLTRMYVFVLILLKVFNLIDFHQFIQLFTLQFFLILIVLIIHLKRKKQLWLCFKTSNLTRRFRKKITTIMIFTFFVLIVSVLRQSIDGIVLAARESLSSVGVFSLATYMVMMIMAPFRSLAAITVPILSREWRKKNISEINRIYTRSSINLLTFALMLFFIIWMNYEQGILFFKINQEYLAGKNIFLLLGIVCIIELGTGLNSQIISTSSYWRFELWTSLLLTLMIIPLSYFLTVKYGIIGPAVANLISFSIYNAIRFGFLWKRFNMQPFSVKTLEVLTLALLCYLLINFACSHIDGLPGIIIRSTLFVFIYGSGVYFRDITPDFRPVVSNLLIRMKLKQKEKRD
jgi:O-antigen/teichoic acid export membrane protein